MSDQDQSKKYFVSVPLRGKYRGEATLLSLGKAFYAKVSVPLRGKYRGEATIRRSMPSFKLSFPSPCGVNIVAKQKEKHQMSKTIRNLESFRPLAG